LGNTTHGPAKGHLAAAARITCVEAEHKHFPEGFEPSSKLIELATDEANAYFSMTYGED
jgi:hypothetical protein